MAFPRELPAQTLDACVVIASWVLVSVAFRGG